MYTEFRNETKPITVFKFRLLSDVKSWFNHIVGYSIVV